MLWQYDVEREKRSNPNPYPSKNDIAYMHMCISLVHNMNSTWSCSCSEDCVNKSPMVWKHGEDIVDCVSHIHLGSGVLTLMLN